MNNSTSLLHCCSAPAHPWETFSVATKWLPNPLRCLVIGESPGEDATRYFYNPYRKVPVRTIMLRELHRHTLISDPTLPSFCKAGFLFDHAIRCLLSRDIILREANLANRYESSRAAEARHLAPFLGQGSSVWVMGRIARNAVAAISGDFPHDTSEISKYPNPRRLPEAQRFFVSRYLLHASEKEIAQIFSNLHLFWTKTQQVNVQYA